MTLNTRTVTLSICASVMGVLVGLVAVGTTGQYTAATGPVLVRSPLITPVAEETSTRVILQRLQESQAAAAASSSAAASAECEAVRAALSGVAFAEQRIVTDEAATTELANVRSAIEQIYCGITSSSSSSAAAVDTNDCDRFVQGTARYVACMLDETGGIN